MPIRTARAVLLSRMPLFPELLLPTSILIKMEYLATWRAMEAFVKAGKCKAIGVSNFTAAQLQHLMDVAELPPAVNQVEVHPYHSQQPLQAFCKQVFSELVLRLEPCCCCTPMFQASHQRICPGSCPGDRAAW